MVRSADQGLIATEMAENRGSTRWVKKAEGGREKCKQEPLLRFLWDGLDKAV